MNIWTGLLFLEGAVADVSLARDLLADPQPARAQDAALDERDPRDTRTAPAFAGPH